MLMRLQSKLTAILIALLFVLLALNPTSMMIAVSLISTVALFGFIEFLERAKIDQIEELKTLIAKHGESVEDSIKKTNERLDSIRLSKIVGGR
jgi:hypothetical protein